MLQTTQDRAVPRGHHGTHGSANPSSEMSVAGGGPRCAARGHDLLGCVPSTRLHCPGWALPSASHYTGAARVVQPGPEAGYGVIATKRSAQPSTARLGLELDPVAGPDRRTKVLARPARRPTRLRELRSKLALSTASVQTSPPHNRIRVRWPRLGVAPETQAVALGNNPEHESVRPAMLTCVCGPPMVGNLAHRMGHGTLLAGGFFFLEGGAVGDIRGRQSSALTGRSSTRPTVPWGPTFSEAGPQGGTITPPTDSHGRTGPAGRPLRHVSKIVYRRSSIPHGVVLGRIVRSRRKTR